MAWDRAWEHDGRRCCGYTNHTLLPEALEQWPVALLERVLPRHLQIIYEINHRFLQQVRRRFPGDERTRAADVAHRGGREPQRAHGEPGDGRQPLGQRRGRAPQRAGEATLFPDFHAMWPERFNNKTNGVTPRRWLLRANPRLAALVTERDRRRLGHAISQRCAALEPLRRRRGVAGRVPGGQARIQGAAGQARRSATTDVRRRSDWLFDVQVKRIHEYKRQLLNVLHVVDLYLAHPRTARTGRAATHVFAGKAAPGYARAKLIIKLHQQRRPTS